jgi:hypothetical protein
MAHTEEVENPVHEKGIGSICNTCNLLSHLLNSRYQPKTDILKINFPQFTLTFHKFLSSGAFRAVFIASHGDCSGLRVMDCA